MEIFESSNLINLKHTERFKYLMSHLYTSVFSIDLDNSLNYKIEL